MKSTPRVELMANHYKKRLLPLAIIAGVICFSFGFGVFFPKSVLDFLMVFFLSFAASNFLYMFLRKKMFQVLVKRYYNGDLDALHRESKAAMESPNTLPDNPDVIETTVEIINTPEEIYGRFMDVEFYEWLDLKVDDEIIRFDFKTTADMSKGKTPDVPPGCICIEPGLVYENKKFTQLLE